MCRRKDEWAKAWWRQGGVRLRTKEVSRTRCERCGGGACGRKGMGGVEWHDMDPWIRAESALNLSPTWPNTAKRADR